MAEAKGKPEIHLFHHTFRRTGGKERYAIALVSALNALEYKVTVHSLKGDAELATQLGVGLDLLPCPRFPRKLQAFYFFRASERRRQGLPGIHISLSRVPVKDLLISGGTHLAYLQRGKKWKGPFDYLQVWLERKSYQSPAHIVAHSDLIASELAEKYFIPEQRLSTLYAPVDDRFRDVHKTRSRAEVRRLLGWPEDKVVFLFPSSGHSRKGLEPISRALSAFADQVVLAVAGRPAGRVQYPFTRSMGYLEDMPAAYRAADFTILGSYYEPFGLVGPESVLCGTRLVFEKGIGCLPAIKAEFVQSFSVWDLASIREAVAEAITLARENKHRIQDPSTALRYDPSPRAHTREVLARISGSLLEA